MKTLLLTCFILLGASAFAADKPAFVFGNDNVLNGEIRTLMQPEQLPEGVNKTLEGAKFTGWRPVVVYKVESGTDRFYEITFVRDEEVINLKVNEDGGKIG